MRTIDDGTKLDPVTTSVGPSAPTDANVGVIEDKTGVGATSPPEAGFEFPASLPSVTELRSPPCPG
ncbi:MAG: hypothetical protein ACREJX_21890, partial [Polyangiaceae bacterium]